MQLGKTNKVIIVLLFLLLVGTATPVLATMPQEVEIEARLVEFDPVSKVYRASGGVVFTSGDFRLLAQTVVYNQDTTLVTAEQGVKLQTATGNLEGETLVYSLRTERGTLTAFRGADDLFFITGQTAELRGEEILVEGGSFTNCELATPCLKIKAGRVRLVDDRVQVRRGWLYLKNLPVLPLPPVTIATDQFADWPQLEIGANSTRGFYVVGKLTHQVNQQVRVNYGGGVGTNKWWNAQGGMRWNLASGLVFSSTLTWEDYLRGNASLTYNWAPLQFRAAVERNWDDLTSGEHTFSVRGPLTKKSNLELIYNSSFNEKRKGENRRQDYGLRLTGRWLPGFTLGAGLYYGEGDLKSNSLNGWHVRTTWSGGINIAPTWRIQVAGETRWQEGIDPLWVESDVKLVKDLHCFKVDLGYDLLDEQISFNFGFNW